eukprot:c31576_g1_i1 orf=3-182(-)
MLELVVPLAPVNLVLLACLRRIAEMRKLVCGHVFLCVTVQDICVLIISLAHCKREQASYK